MHIISSRGGVCTHHLYSRCVFVNGDMFKVVLSLLVLQVLSKYRSGKLPKAFKIIPALSNWEQVLYLTDPDSWSAAAMYQATR